ncbi:Serine/threonine-protein phosphatase 6 regulatory ankyrin repeat subunit A [Merluccius polli]|uniref:Serine/threonine-protein phosphatase 6 regulatory ankyrin repeat subunit A n=1 Tax=Merluccius polli TaxID=89951 RepID=A0AA47NN77_MERPO|nr:Serine/threonine-protein phosphatase 6 regulatory ankyrin repeat subunit A [Merluccius polli]
MFFLTVQINEPNVYGNTPLHVACYNGQDVVVNEFIECGANVNQVNEKGFTPLHFTAASRHGALCLELLVCNGADVNIKSKDGKTPLHMTAIHGRFSRSQAVIKNGAEIDCEDKNGNTPLHIAARYGHELLINTLITNGADTAKCLCGRCRPMETVVESLCCREVSAFWSLVEELTPRPADVTCLTQHPGFDACCLNPFVLKIAYSHFRQDHGPLQASRHEQYRYTAYRQAIRWAYGVLGLHIRKPLPSCLVSTIRQQFQSGDETYHGFQWPQGHERNWRRQGCHGRGCPGYDSPSFSIWPPSQLGCHLGLRLQSSRVTSNNYASIHCPEVTEILGLIVLPGLNDDRDGVMALMAKIWPAVYTKPYLLYLNKSSFLLYNASIRLLTTGRTEGKQAHELLLANNEFVNATTTKKREVGGLVRGVEVWVCVPTLTILGFRFTCTAVAEVVNIPKHMTIMANLRGYVLA